MSDINPTNIDGSYPIAGQNQSSDGFRTNFTNIKSNLTFAKDEITDLQNKVLLKASLTGSTLDNDMDRSALTKAQLKNYSLSINAKGSVSGTVSLSPTDGNYVTMTLTDPATLAFDTNAGNYPAATSQAFIFFVQMTISDIAQTLTLPTSVNKGTTSLVGFNSGNRKITHTYTGTYIYQLITVDAGVSWSIIDLTNTASTVNATSATSTIGNMVLSGNTITTSGTNEPLRISPDATSATGYTIITGNLKVTNATIIGNSTYASGAIFTVVSTGAGPYAYSTVTATTAGTGYEVGRTIKILGSNLGGVDVTNDAIVTVNTASGVGGILTASISGVAVNASTRTGKTGLNYNTDAVYIAGGNIQALGSTANLTLDVETSSNWVVLSNQTEVQGNLNVSQSNLSVTGGTIYTRGESYSWASTVTANASISSAGFYKVDFLDGSAKTVTLTLSPPVTDGDVLYVMVNSRAASQLANIVSGNATCNIYHAAGNVNGNVSVSTEIYGTVRLIGTKSQSTNKWVVASYTGNLTYV